MLFTDIKLAIKHKMSKLGQHKTLRITVEHQSYTLEHCKRYIVSRASFNNVKLTFSKRTSILQKTKNSLSWLHWFNCMVLMVEHILNEHVRVVRILWNTQCTQRYNWLIIWNDISAKDWIDIDFAQFALKKFRTSLTKI